MIKKELLDMTSNSSQVNNNNFGGESSNANSTEESRLKKRSYHRRTPEQLQELEAFFKENPNPNQKQRTELSQLVDMDPLQVKFWFQNKRTQMKTSHEHKENNQLRIENENLRAENLRFKEALKNITCLHCGLLPTSARKPSSNEHHLGQKTDHIPSVSTNHVGRNIAASTENLSPPADFGSENFKAVYGGHNAGDRSLEVDLAMSAMEELMRVAQLGEPLWVRSMDQSSIVLNEEEYFRTFSRIFKQKTNGFKFEASRESVVVPMYAATVVEILMNVELWESVFSGVVSRTDMQVISSGLSGTHNEEILLMNVELHVPSLLVPTRQSYILRYCKRHVDGIWAVVDVSLDHLNTTSPVTYRRRPSGCLIQDITNGHSKIIWVEHVEVEDEGIENIYKPLITSGLAFGARRWIAILEGYCQRLVRTFSTEVPSDTGRMLKLAERMVTRFCRGVNTSIVNTWTSLSGDGSENVKFMIRTNVDDPGMPFGLLLSIATSFWLPIPPKRVFDFLCDNNTRKVWDMLLSGGDTEEMAHIVSGNEELNRVTLYKIKGSDSSSNQMIMLQENRSDPTASYVVYAPINMVCANAVLGGDDPSTVPILPSGFAILPDGPTCRGQGRRMPAQADTGGTLLTVALQILIGSTPNATLSMESVVVASKLISSTVDKIKQTLIPRS